MSDEKTKRCGVCKKEMQDDGWNTCHECISTMSKAIDLMKALSDSKKTKGKP